MAVFDLAAQRMRIRIVYDGVAGAGKTTNLKQLCTLFATQRTTESHSPAEIRGRTLYFDWVQIAAGVICAISAHLPGSSPCPGQVVLTAPTQALHLVGGRRGLRLSHSTQAGAARAQRVSLCSTRSRANEASAIPLSSRRTSRTTPALRAARRSSRPSGAKACRWSRRSPPTASA